MRQLGSTALKVSPICFGTWQLSPRFWGAQPEEVVAGAMRRAFSLGINFYDTADAYGDGLAEQVLGRALKPLPRDRLVVATKVYWHFDEKGARHPDLRPDYIPEACDASLRRLGTDYIDLYQCHFFDPLVKQEDVFGALDALVEKGKVRAYGVSNWSAEQLRLGLARGGKIQSIQPPYSLISREIEKDILPLAQACQIGVLTYNSLHRGMLTGKFSGNEQFTDLRRNDKDFQGERFETLAKKVGQLKDIASSYGLTTTQLVLAVTLMHPGITAAIVGVKNEAQIEEAAGALDKSVSHRDAHEVRKILAESYA